MAAVQIALDFGGFGKSTAALTPREPHAPRQPHTLRAVPAIPEPSAPELVSVSIDKVPIDKLQLEATLRAAVDAPLRVTITDNRRTMISLRKRPGFTELRLHHMFLSADADTVRALGDYVGRSDRNASVELGRYIEAHRARIRRRVTRALSLSTRGEHHDLLAVYADVNARYFQGKVEARISWSREPAKSARSRRARRRSIKLGSYCSRERLIRVHPALDAAFVPRFFVEYIVYHEMLHHMLPPIVRGGRRQLHDRRFKEHEQAFPDYAAALQWERENLDRLLAI